MYYEYFRERAALCRRTAEGTNERLSMASLDMARMFDEMAVDVLIREFYQSQAARAEFESEQQRRSARWSPAALKSPRPSWWRLWQASTKPRSQLLDVGAVEWAGRAQARTSLGSRG